MGINDKQGREYSRSTNLIVGDDRGDFDATDPEKGLGGNILSNATIVAGNYTTAERDAIDVRDLFVGSQIWNTDEVHAEWWTGSVWEAGVAGGDVIGVLPTTDNTIARWDGVDSLTIQGSGVVIDDNNNMLFTPAVDQFLTLTIADSAGEDQVQLSYADDGALGSLQFGSNAKVADGGIVSKGQLDLEAVGQLDIISSTSNIGIDSTAGSIQVDATAGTFGVDAGNIVIDDNGNITLATAAIGDDRVILFGSNSSLFQDSDDLFTLQSIQNNAINIRAYSGNPGDEPSTFTRLDLTPTTAAFGLTNDEVLADLVSYIRIQNGSSFVIRDDSALEGIRYEANYFLQGNWTDRTLTDKGYVDAGDIITPDTTTENAIVKWGDTTGDSLVDSLVVLMGRTFQTESAGIDINPFNGITALESGDVNNAVLRFGNNTGTSVLEIIGNQTSGVSTITSRQGGGSEAELNIDGGMLNAIFNTDVVLESTSQDILLRANAADKVIQTDGIMRLTTGFTYTVPTDAAFIGGGVASGYLESTADGADMASAYVIRRAQGSGNPPVAGRLLGTYRFDAYDGAATITNSALSVNEDEATAVTAVDHNLVVGQQVTIAGASPAYFNGTFEVDLVLGPNIYTYILAEPDGSAIPAGTTNGATYHPAAAIDARAPATASANQVYGELDFKTNDGGTEATIRAILNEFGFSYEADYAGDNASNPRWLPDKAYVDGNSTIKFFPDSTGLPPIELEISTADIALGGLLMVVDNMGNAATNNITVTVESGTINGQPQIVMNADYAVLTLVSDGTNLTGGA